ncbi:hypothetical protein MPTK1_6g03660 [Marchantia polymorpha subsp. ruderalis]|uniref:Uncharacterized protein n=2 Tax=Marchantia polymorpha TaxID=3197 RepID=A0AAF6BN75_MARPO|nr:hypothetical protein MARPO_0035s0145 [Marchantia polymorpha]BBN13459.1 hypothetical protein Mp_6g03660 [Marchantia polymorpha subsp. ruderalis]|eukprot:PTQ41379.1 hypothetical protein MARPO_0035s0145 [Marchantia polymorpha]
MMIMDHGAFGFQNASKTKVASLCACTTQLAHKVVHIGDAAKNTFCWFCAASRRSRALGLGGHRPAPQFPSAPFSHRVFYMQNRLRVQGLDWTEFFNTFTQLAHVDGDGDGAEHISSTKELEIQDASF